MKNYFSLLLIFFSISSFSQSAGDTTIIETLDFNDITKRRGWYIFPSDTNSYHKVLMYYTLKCDAATTQDNYACGEWDYTTYTRLYNHNNVNTPYYYYKNSTPENITYNNSPKFDIHQSNTFNLVVDAVLSENSFTIGSGANTSSEFLNTSSKNGSAQYLVTAVELQNQGLTAGFISRMSFNIQSQGDQLSNLAIKMKPTTLTALTDSTFETDNFITVYDNSNLQQPQSSSYFNFLQPFNWDGISNVLVAVNFTAVSNNSNYSVNADSV